MIRLRNDGWKSLPPPPVFTTSKPQATGADKKDLSVTPVAVSLGLPNTDLEPLPPWLTSVTAVEAGTPPFPTAQSPSLRSITTLSDFTAADISEDESPIDPGPVNSAPVDSTPTSPTDPTPIYPTPTPTDPTIITPHSAFNFEDGNVEVLCENTLFRVHTSILSLHSPVLRQTFVRANLASADSPNGCPRIPLPDTAADFTTLLKIVYLPGYVTLPLC